MQSMRICPGNAKSGDGCARLTGRRDQRYDLVESMSQMGEREALYTQTVRGRLVVAPAILVEVTHPGMPGASVCLDDQPPRFDETVDPFVVAPRSRRLPMHR